MGCDHQKQKQRKDGESSMTRTHSSPKLSLIREGSHWTIGDGCLAKCDQPWVLGDKPVWKPSRSNQTRKEETVRSLIKEDTNEWDNLKLEQNFSTNTIMKILSIETMERGSEDALVWKREKLGNYTVRSGYSMQLEAQNRQINGHIKRNWDILWKADMNNKWKIFLWKLLNNRLHVGEEFIKRRIVVDSMCKFCDTHVESLDHLFRDCNCARNEIMFNKGNCNAKGILDRVERTFNIETQGGSKCKEYRTRKRKEDPEEPPGFERDKKLEEPPGFERNLGNKGNTSHHLIGKRNNCDRRVLHSYDDFKEEGESIVYWSSDLDGSNNNYLRMHCSSKEQANLRAFLKGINEVRYRNWRHLNITTNDSRTTRILIGKETPSAEGRNILIKIIEGTKDLHCLEVVLNT
ncbi:hypothetical protein SOVF_144600 [Spinacia oleracea]|nr:hypothetical protein SOVF_144600 [Spinacia oleracea]